MTTVGTAGPEGQSLWSRRVLSQSANLGPETDRACWLPATQDCVNQDQSQEKELGFLTGGKQSPKKLFVEVCQEIELL